MLLFEWGSHLYDPRKKEYIMSTFENLLKSLRNRQERQKSALEETEKQIAELEEVIKRGGK